MKLNKLVCLSLIAIFAFTAFAAMPFNSIAQDTKDDIINGTNLRFRSDSTPTDKTVYDASTTSIPLSFGFDIQGQGGNDWERMSLASGMNKIYYSINNGTTSYITDWTTIQWQPTDYKYTKTLSGLTSGNYIRICLNDRDIDIYNYAETEKLGVGVDRYYKIRDAALPPSLNNDFTFSFINANITSGLEEFRPYCNGTGENLDSAIIYIDFWLYYVSNNSEIHFLNDTAIINYETNEDYYYDTYLFVPDVFDSEVCRFKAKAVIVEYLLCDNGRDSQINLVSQIAVSSPFTITNETPYLNPDAAFANPSIYDNYTTRHPIEVMGGGTGDYLEGVNITIDMYCYFVSNSTIIHYDNYTKSNDFETGWYVDDFTTFGFNETNVIRLIVRCMITPELLCKDDYASDVVWGISSPITITKMAVQIYTPNGDENYTAESEHEIIFNVTDIQEYFTVNIEVSLSINGIDGDYTIIKETEIMMGEENLYYKETVTWETPDNLSYDCWIKVNVSATTIPTYLTEALIDYAEDKSDGNFTIYKPTAVPPIVPPSHPITITFLRVGVWVTGDIGEATAYTGDAIQVIVNVESDITISSVTISYSNDIDGLEYIVAMSRIQGTAKDGNWSASIPAQDSECYVTFNVTAENIQGDSETTDDIIITVTAQAAERPGFDYDTLIRMVNSIYFWLAIAGLVLLAVALWFWRFSVIIGLGLGISAIALLAVAGWQGLTWLGVLGVFGLERPREALNASWERIKSKYRVLQTGKTPGRYNN
jgi:hypothetical protein